MTARGTVTVAVTRSQKSAGGARARPGHRNWHSAAARAHWYIIIMIWKVAG